MPTTRLPAVGASLWTSLNTSWEGKVPVQGLGLGSLICEHSDWQNEHDDRLMTENITFPQLY